MKNSILLFFILNIFLTLTVEAQPWVDPNNDQTGEIYYNGGKVGIGQVDPKYQLDIKQGFDHAHRMLRLGTGTGSDMTFDVAAGSGLGNIAFGAEIMYQDAAGVLHEERLSGAAPRYVYTGGRGAALFNFHDGYAAIKAGNYISGTKGEKVSFWTTFEGDHLGAVRLSKNRLHIDSDAGFGFVNIASGVKLGNQPTHNTESIRNAYKKYVYNFSNKGSARLKLDKNEFVFYRSDKLDGVRNELVNYLESMRIDADGNVGVGTTTPTEKLHIKDGALKVEIDQATGLACIAEFKNTGTSNTNNTKISVGNDATQMNIGIGAAGTTAGHAYLWSNSGDVMIGPDGSPTMVIEHAAGTNGRVSIGAHKSPLDNAAHTPAAALHVGGEISHFYSELSTQGQIHIGGGNNVYDDQYIVFPNPGIHESGSAQSETMWWSSDMFFGRYLNDFTWGFKATGTATANDPAKQIINAKVDDIGGDVFLNTVSIAPKEGKVGIGTSNPAHKLTIADGELSLYDSNYGLDGSTLQRFVLYSREDGLYFESPKKEDGTNVPYRFGWRGGEYAMTIDEIGKVHVGSKANMEGYLTVYDKNNIGSEIGDREVLFNLVSQSPHYDQLEIEALRVAEGNNHGTMVYRIQRDIDDWDWDDENNEEDEALTNGIGHGGYIEFGHGNESNGVGTDALRFGAGVGAEYARFAWGGNFGIGTTEPTEKLTLNDGNIALYGTEYEQKILSDGKLSIYANGSDATDSYSRIELLGTELTEPERTGNLVLGASAIEFWSGADNTRIGNQAMKLSNDGDLTLNQGSLVLDNGSIVFADGTTLSSANQVGGGNSGEQIFTGDKTFDDMVTFKGGTVFEDIICIGTTNPHQNYPGMKMAVNGNILCEEVKVNDVDGADYVFEEDYDLASIEQVEKFIKKNHHLPNIPSAKEMKEEGIGLVEMNIKLLSKIEELTLYTIQQNKENKELRTEVDELKKIVTSIAK